MTAGLEDATPAAAVEQLMASEGGRIYGLGLRICRDSAAAEDLAQETFLQAFRHWDQFEGRSEPSTWLYTIAGRICQRWGRQRSGEPQRLESLSELLPSGESAVAALPAGEQNALDKQLESETRTRVDAALAELPVRFRLPLVLKDIHLLPMSADYETLARSDEFAHIRSGLVELNDLLAARGARLLVVYIPSKEHVYWSRIWDPEDVNAILERTVTVTLSEGNHGFLQWEPSYLDFDTFNANHNAQERLFEDMAREAGIEFLNLTPLFWQEAIRRGELYNYMDLHWNQAGNQLVADAVAGVVEGQ